MSSRTLAVLAMAAILAWVPVARGQDAGVDDDPDPEFEVHGFIQNQTGIFISPDQEEFTLYREYAGDRGEKMRSAHGGKLGSLSMLRNTFQIEMDWRPDPIVQLHATLRGVFSPSLRPDREAQVPEFPGYYLEPSIADPANEDPQILDPDRRVSWVARNYYQEASIRELYLDITPHPIVSFRVGRQLVAWGETGSARLLDVVNPIDATWHFGALESFEDQRIPLWIVKALVEVPPLDGSLEVVWVPMVPFIERPEDTVTVPLTFVGAWGLPLPGWQADATSKMKSIHSKVFHYPDQNPLESRVGARWKGELGPLVYTLMYYWGHQSSPPVPRYALTSDTGKGFDIHLDFPRQHVAGLSLEYNVPFPVSSMLKLEATIEPDRTYPRRSLESKVDDPDDPLRFNFDNIQKLTVNYAFTWQQPIVARFLNPDDTLVLAIQFQHSVVPTWDPAERLLEIPGYDSTLMPMHRFQLGGALFTSYLHGTITPRISGAWIFGYRGLRNDTSDRSQTPEVDLVNGGGLLSASVAFALGTHWRVNVALNEFFAGPDAYYGVGLFGDRDEVNVTVRYQF
jgi:hypothetical protein